LNGLQLTHIKGKEKRMLTPLEKRGGGGKGKRVITAENTNISIMMEGDLPTKGGGSEIQTLFFSLPLGEGKKRGNNLWQKARSFRKLCNSGRGDVN